jgi:molybdate transport system regulatory protein
MLAPGPAALSVNSKKICITASCGLRCEGMTRLTLRIDFDQGRALGPGKIKLLELIDALGSISAAGRQMGMSYRRAWLLIDDLNQSFRQPVVASRVGGAHGGGAALTDLGCAVVRHYRAAEAAALAAGAAHIGALTAALSAHQPGKIAESKKGKKRHRESAAET